MKRVRCPKCDNFIKPYEKNYNNLHSLKAGFPICIMHLGLRMFVSAVRTT